MEQRIGRYEIVETIGKGVAGTIFLARDPASGRDVAVETVDVAGPRADEAREHVLKRAGLASHLSHRNIAAVYEVGSENGTAFVAREYVEGQSLAQYILEGAPFRPVAVLAWLEQIAAAVDYANEHGIVHGGLDPKRILVSRTGEVKVTGFGLARSIAKVTGAPPEAPFYMAPETIRGEAADRAADVYSFGAIVYEMVTGHPPFESESIVTSIFRAVNEPPMPPVTLAPELPEEIDAILLRALDKTPADRFATCSEIVAAVSAVGRTSGLASETLAGASPAADVRFCDQCGAALRPDVKFCYRCGSATIPPIDLYETNVDTASEPTLAPAVAETSVTGAPPPAPEYTPDLVAPPPRIAPPVSPSTTIPTIASAPPPPLAKVAPPLSGYAMSSGTHELPPPGAEIEPEPEAGGWKSLAVTIAIFLAILAIFVMLGWWLAPKLLTPYDLRPAETSAVIAVQIHEDELDGRG